MKPCQEFGWRQERNNYRSDCLECNRIYNRQLRAAKQADGRLPPQKHRSWFRDDQDARQRALKSNKMKVRYGIDIDEYEAILAAQNNQCATCDREWSKSLHIDHCHTTNKVRGLLCGRCNPALGLVNEDIKILERMLDYVRDAGNTI